MATNPNKTRDLATPSARSGNAVSFLQPTEPSPARKPTAKERKNKASVRYMQQHGIDIENIDSLDYMRLNCDIPKELHTWLNVFARSSNEYSSMTEIVIEQLGKFAKERGFVINKQ